MLKSYEGFSLPRFTRVAYVLDYRCPVCSSEKVDIDQSASVPDFCDGSPSTADELRRWTCTECSHCASGSLFVFSAVKEDE